MSNLVRLSVDGGVGVITVDNPPVNALSPGVPEGILAGVGQFGDDDSVDAIVLIGGGRTFIAGADITELMGRTPLEHRRGLRFGQALFEELRYDDAGQPLVTTLVDYLVPSAAEVPNIETLHIESPSPLTLGGVKGMGEGGAINSPAAIANAVADALRPLGVTRLEMPLTPERVWQAIQDAKV